MTILEYIDNYLESETAFRDMYGENSYFSKPAIHGRDNDIIPIAPWAYYFGDPLILPSIEFVDYMGLSEATSDGQIQTDVYYLKHVVSVLDQAYGVQSVDLPVPHTITYLRHRESLCVRIEMLRGSTTYQKGKPDIFALWACMHCIQP